MMRVSDYICERLATLGVKDVFIVTGGGAMFLNDAIGREKRFNVVPMHHEQGASMASEAYARLGGRPALLNVTTGPGGINAINGVFGAYTDSVPMIVVSGQVKRETMISTYDLPLRQLGDQEVDIVSMIRGVTKYSTVLRDPKDVCTVVDRAFHLATTGRPGPVWIDVPIDVQGSLVDVDSLEKFDARTDSFVLNDQSARVSNEDLVGGIDEIMARLNAASRPVVLAGGGIRASGQYSAFLRTIGQMGVPVVTGWNAHDLLPNDHPLFAGKPGSLGDRAGNFAVQNADFLLVLGSRLNVRQVSYNWQSFARHAFKVMVDIDAAELAKPTLSIDLPICADLTDFFDLFEKKLAGHLVPPAHKEYLSWVQERVRAYPVLLPEYAQQESPINPYSFVDALFAQLQPGETVVTGDGTACVVSFQGAKIKPGQRLFTNSGCASMGYDLPGAVGAYYAGGASETGRLVCLAGDGSIMMNLQELATIAGRKLPIKIFILNNDGYHSIRQSQQAHFPDNIVGCGPDSGLTFPDYVELCQAFGIKSARCSELANVAEEISNALKSEGPYVCEIMIDKEQQFSPKLTSRRLEDGKMVSSPLEDMAPFLSRKELAANMLVD